MNDVMEQLAFTARTDLVNVPTWIQVLPAGIVDPKGKSKFKVDAAARTEILANYGKLKNDMVIDYEHQTLKDKEAPAAGWIKELADKGDGETGGIWARVEWTKRAVEYLKNREYRYLSPVVMIKRTTAQAIELVNAALTNAPAIDGMVPVVNKQDSEIRLPETTQEGAEELESLKRQIAAQEIENVVQAALKAGKITPAMLAGARSLAEKDLSSFKAFIEAAPVLVTLKELASGNGPTPGGPDDLQGVVNKNFGISDESFKKYNGKAV